MNYYLIPKNNFNININVQLTSSEITPYVSYSLIFYMNSIYNQLFKLQENIDNENIDNKDDDNKNNISIEYINQIVNPFEFIYTNVPGSTISVSKVKPDSSIFFELMELFQLFGINDILTLKNKINIAHLTHNHYNNKLDLIICEFHPN